MKQALAWSTKAVELRPEAYWMSRLKAQIQAAIGDYKGAIETANFSIAAAEKDGDQNYVKMNKASSLLKTASAVSFLLSYYLTFM